MIPVWLQSRAALAAALVAAGAASGWAVNGWRLGSQLASERAQAAAAAAAAEKASRVEVEGALALTRQAIDVAENLKGMYEQEAADRAGIMARLDSERSRMRNDISEQLAKRCGAANSSTPSGRVPTTADARGMSERGDVIGLLGAMDGVAAAAFRRAEENRARALKLEAWVDKVALPTCNADAAKMQ